jgi:hypothetical protein
MWCPACDDTHAVEIESEPRWGFDGNLQEPTISPSIKVEGVQWEVGHTFHKPHHHVVAGEPVVCHSFVRAGRWEFLGDCTHDLAGQTVEMVPVPAWLMGETK